MNAAHHPLLSKPAPHRTPYCVDCYQDGGKVTVATRMFGDDELCDPHYVALCKDMGVEPDVITLSEARSAKEIAQPSPIKKIRQAAKPSDHPITRSPDHPIQSFPSDSELAEAAQSLPDHPISSTSQRPDSSVAPAAEGGQDRAHSPTQPAPSQGSGVPQTPSAANPQPSQPERNANPMANICGRPGCGKKLSAANHSGFCGDHWYDSKKKNGATRGHKPAANQSPQVHVNDVAPPHQSNGHAMPPVTIANGNGHPAPPIQMIARSVIAADGAYLVPCQVSEWAMDRIWLRLTPEEKAELLFRSPEAPQKEQQEPSHA